MAVVLPALHIACSLNDSDQVKKLLSDKNYAKRNINKFIDNLAPLHYAIEKGFINVVETLLSNEADVMLLDGEGYTPLHIACLTKHTVQVKLSIINLLLKYGANVIQCVHEKSGLTCLHAVVLSGTLEILELLLSQIRADKGPGLEFINHCDHKGKSALHHACRHTDCDSIVKCLLKHGACVHSQTNIGRTPLHLAAFCGHVKCVRVLLEHNADVNVQDEEGWTAVILASQEGHPAIIKVICKYGADLTLTSKTGRNAIHAACLYGYIECVDSILCHPASEALISAPDSNGQTPLHVASRYGHLEIVKDFLSGRFSNIILDFKDSNGRTALHYAVIDDQYSVAGLLIQMGSNISARDSNQWTPLHVACERGYTRIAKLLVSHGANIDEITDTGRNSLHLAAVGGHLVAAEFLLENGIDVQVLDNDGWSPIHLATKKDHEIIVDILATHPNDKINKLVYDNTRKSKVGPLHFAIYNCNTEIASTLLDNEADVMLLDGEGYSPLHIACSTGNVSIVKLLLKGGAQLRHVHEGSGSTVLHKAVCSGSLELVELLVSYIKSKDFINFCDKSKWSSLHFACYHGHHLIAKYLLKHGANVSNQTNTGKTALHLAACNGFVKCTKHLLCSGVDVDVQDEGGWTAIILASQNDHPKIVKLILEKKPNLNLTNGKEQNAIHVACLHGNIECVKHILEYSCFKSLILSCDGDGCTPFHLASQKGHLDVVKLLHARSPPCIVNSKAKDGSTPLHHAVMNGKYSMVLLLLHMRSDMSVKDMKGWTPLHVASNSGHINIVKLLVSYGSNIHDVIDCGRNSLHLATLEGYSLVVEFLLLCCIDYQLQDENGWSPLHLAVKKGHQKIVEILLQQPNGCINKLVYDDGFKCKVGPLHLAIKGEFTDVIKVLLQQKADMMLVDSDKHTPFHIACSTGNVYVAKLLLEHGAEAECVHDESGSTSLHEAIQSGSHALVEFLLSQIKSLQFINLGDKNWWTPLHFACHHGHHHIATCLIKHGADTDAQNNTGKTSLHLAAIKGFVKCAEVLLGHNADVNIRDKDGSTAVDLASQRCHPKFVKLICEVYPNLALSQERAVEVVKQFCSSEGLTFDSFVIDSRDENDRTPLHIAVMKDRYDVVKILIQMGANISLMDQEGWTPLLIACKNGYTNIVKLLVSHEATINHFTIIGRHSPLQLAINGKFNDIIEILLEKKIVVMPRDSDNCTPLCAACSTGSVAVVKMLLDHGVEAKHIHGESGCTPLHKAVCSGLLELVEFLLSRCKSEELKCFVNMSDTNGWSALHIACHNGHHHIASCLIKNGAYVDKKTNAGRTALHLSALNGLIGCTKVLLESNVDVNVKDVEGCSAVVLSSQEGHSEVVKLICERNPRLMQINKMGQNAMHVACLHGHVKCIDCILEHIRTIEPTDFAAIITATDNEGMTPLQIASQKGHLKIVKLFLSQKCIKDVINAKDKSGMTALHLAVMEGRLDVTNFLIKSGSDICARDSKGWTALHMACSKGYDKIAMILILHSSNVNDVVECPDYTKTVDSFVVANDTVKQQWSPLHLAVQEGHQKIVEFLLERSKQSINQTVYDRLTEYYPIHLAAKGGFTEITNILISNGANLNVLDSEGCTPVQIACKTGKISVVRVLLDHGAKAEYVTGGLNSTALQYAVCTGSLKLVELLLSQTKSQKIVNVSDYIGWSPLHFACQYGYFRIAKSLLKRGANVCSKLKTGRTALHLAAFEGFAKCAEALLKFDVKVDVQDENGWTAVMLASQEGHHEIVKLICEHSPNLALTGQGKRNAAHMACAHGRVKCFEQIIECHKSTNIISAVDKNRMTPFHHACKEGHLEMVKLFHSKNISRKVIFNTSGGITPLNCAIITGRYNVVDFLISIGLDISVSDSYQMSPLHIASEYGYTKIAELLIANGALINSITSMGRNSLHLAAFKGNASTVLFLIETGISYLLEDDDGWTPLHLAAQEGHEHVVEVLLQQPNIQVNCQANNMRTPLHSCSYHGNERITHLLLNKGSDWEIKDKSGWTALHLCAQQGHLKVVEKLIHIGADPNVQSNSKRTPMHLACMKGRKDVVEYLLKKNAEVDIKDTNQWTPLCDACQDNQTDIIDLLVQHRANVNVKTGGGRNPLHLAAFKGFSKACKILLDHDVELDSKDNEGWTALHLAAQEGSLEVVQLLVDHHADLEATANNGRRPLDMCSSSGHTQIVKYLISRGSVSNEADVYQWTPMHWACIRGHQEVVEELLSSKADIDAVTMEGHSLLHLCTIKGHKVIAELLIKKKINVDIKDRDGKTALHFACEYGYEKITELLLNHDIRIDALDNKEWTPLHYACYNCHKVIVSQLMNRANIYLGTDCGKNCLHLAALNGGAHVCEILLKNDKEQRLLSHQDKDGWTPLHLASYAGHLDIVELFVSKYKANVKVCSTYSWTPLHLALLLQHKDIVQFLISQGAQHDLDNLSPIINAIIGEDKKQMEKILRHLKGVEAVRSRIVQGKAAEEITPSTAPKVASAEDMPEITPKKAYTTESGTDDARRGQQHLTNTRLLNADDIPTINKLQEFEVIEKIAPRWEKIADALQFPSHVVDIIKVNNVKDCEQACRDMLKRWLNRRGDTLQPSWRTLIEVLKDNQEASLVKDLKKHIA